MLHRKKGGWFTLVLSLALIVGCTAKPIDHQPKVLRILVDDVFDVVDEFQEDYLQLFEVKYPDVEIELIKRSTWSQQIKPGEDDFYIWLDERFPMLKNGLTTPEYPDVLILNDEELLYLIEEELLYPLEAFIEKSNFDIENIGYGVQAGIRDLGNGTLYALTPYFYSKVLLYNKDFFDKRNIAYPSDGINHEELFALAKELSYEEGGETYFGLTFGSGHSTDIWYFPYHIKSLGLTYFDEDGKVAVNTPEWEKVWTDFVELRTLGGVPSLSNYMEEELPPSFLNGRIAMTFDDRREIIKIINQEQQDLAFQPFQWDMVSIPSSLDYPDRSPLARFDDPLMAINIHAGNPELAWEFISFINGEEFARIKANTILGLVSRPNAYNDQINGVSLNLSAFYEKKPLPTVIRDEERRKLDILERWILDVGVRELVKVLDDGKDSEAAFRDFQHIVERELEGWKSQFGIQ